MQMDIDGYFTRYFENPWFSHGRAKFKALLWFGESENEINKCFNILLKNQIVSFKLYFQDYLFLMN